MFKGVIMTINSQTFLEQLQVANNFKSAAEISSNSAPTTAAEQFTEAGRRFSQLKHYQEAAYCYEKGSQEWEKVENFFLSANCLEAAGNEYLSGTNANLGNGIISLEEAAERYQRDFQPDCAKRVFLTLAGVYVKLNVPVPALSACFLELAAGEATKCRDNNTTIAGIYHQAAEFYEQANNNSSALDCYQRAFEHYPAFDDKRRKCELKVSQCLSRQGLV